MQSYYSKYVCAVLWRPAFKICWLVDQRFRAFLDTQEICR